MVCAGKGWTVKRNFKFGVISVAHWEGRLLDLHNDYDLEGFGTDLDGNAVSLNFVRNEHAIDPEALPLKLTLACTGNVKVAFNDLAAVAAPLNDGGIELAYFDDACDWLSYLDEDVARSQEPRGLHVSFNSGLAIRIFCDRAMLSTRHAPS